MDGNPCSSVLILGSRSVQQFCGNHLVGNYGSADKSQAACSPEDSPVTTNSIKYSEQESSNGNAYFRARYHKHLLRHANWSSSLGDVIRIS